MKIGLITALLMLTACGKSEVVVQSSTHRIEVENPIITFCERLNPAALYPDEFERESNIVDCLQICQNTDNCALDLPIVGI